MIKIKKKMQILIKNGLIVTQKDSIKEDLLIEDGKIARRGNNIEFKHGHEVPEIDASGMLVIPGGIDPHVHMRLPTPAGYSADNFRTGSMAALAGGTTSFIDFVTPKKGQSLPDAFRQRLNEAENSAVDFSFHVSPISWHQNLEEEIRECLTMGVKSFKVYTAYLDTVGIEGEVLKNVVRLLAINGGMLTVHAETGREIERLRNDYFSQGNITPLYHALSRPAETESEAIKMLVDLVEIENCPMYVVHVSAAQSLSHINSAKNRNLKVYAETCPQYLVLDQEKYNQPFNKAAKYVLSPPLRTKNDNESLWDALANNTLDTVGTDHCPFTLEQKRLGLADFRKIPNGIGGVEHRLSLLFSKGVIEKRISLNRWVELISTNPAKIFGLYPRKGSLNIGADADVVIWNPNTKRTISAATHKQNTDINAYEGIETTGVPEHVILRGNIVVSNENLQDTSNLKGSFLRQK